MIKMMENTRNEIKLSFEKPKYYISEKRGVVKCYLKGIAHYPNLTYMGESRVISVSATAKCAEGEVFDESRGKKISLARAENLAYGIVEKEIRKYLLWNEETVKAVEKCKNFIAKSKRHNKHNEDYIREISEL